MIAAAILLLFAQVHVQVQAEQCPNHCSEDRIAAYESHISVTWSMASDQDAHQREHGH
jgi:hypothetical protein